MQTKPLSLMVIGIVLFLSGCFGNTPAETPAASPAPPTEAPLPTATIPPAAPTATPLNCIPSGNQAVINAALSGVNAEAILCPGAVFELAGPVRFTADGQKVYTAGQPTDDTRAVLRVTSNTLTTAVIMRDFDNAVLSHVVVDGNRPALGYRAGDALILAGGSSSGQVIRSVRIIEPRSWSALHLIQGHPAPEPPCTGAIVEDNVIGPAGMSNETWADGISLACTNTTVRNNLVVDATDGGIVIFGAPGSLIEGNTIRAETRTLLGGINMVDVEPYNGDYTQTIVRNNTIDAAGAVIRIGLGMGNRVWGCVPEETTKVLKGGWVSDNVLKGPKMQYGYIVDGVANWTVLNNKDEATHSGTPSRDCRGVVASRPAGFQYHPARAQGTFQPEFAEANLELALWAIITPRPGE